MRKKHKGNVSVKTDLPSVGRTHKGRHTTAAGVTKAHPIGTKPARRKASKAARASRKANR